MPPPSAAPTPAPSAAPAPFVTPSAGGATLPPPTRVEAAPIAWKPVVGVRTGDRPLLVWIGDPVRDASAEHRAFDDTDVRLAARAFRVVRIAPTAAAADPLLAPHAARAPVAVVFSPGLERASDLDGPLLDPRSVLASLDAAALAYERLDLRASVTRARAILSERAGVERERAALAAVPPTDATLPSRRAALDERLAALDRELAALFTPRA